LANVVVVVVENYIYSVCQQLENGDLCLSRRLSLFQNYADRSECSVHCK